MSESSIVFEQVNVSIGKRPVLHEINVSLLAGRSYAVLGPTGSGKTSLLRAMAGKLFPRQGKIHKKAKIEFVPSDYKFHRFVGAVYQYYQQRYHAYDSELGPTLYEVLQNQVKPMGTIDERSVELNPPQYDDAHLFAVCSRFNIDHLLQRKITSLSTGETRRSLLARSVLKNPDFLLLDNPFVGLDTASRERLREILKSLERISVVMVCSVGDVPDNIDHFIYLEDGRIVDEPSARRTENVLRPAIASQIQESMSSRYEFDIAVKFSKSSVRYGDFYALKNFSWEVKRGDKWALMGPNGSGKSTIISLITADNPQAYSNQLFLFDQKRGSGESIWDIKKKIGYVSPELQLYCEKDIAVWKLVASGLFDTAGLYSELSDPQLKTVFDYLKLVGIETIAERQFDQLSTGEQRLVFLARALVKNPPLLILDEPCQGLDYGQMIHFRNIIDELVPSFGKTLIYVSHYEEEIPKCVNLRLNISGGEIVNA